MFANKTGLIKMKKTIVTFFFCFVFYLSVCVCVLLSGIKEKKNQVSREWAKNKQRKKNKRNNDKPNIYLKIVHRFLQAKKCNQYRQTPT